MRNKFILLLAILSLGMGTAHAQWIVSDPSSLFQSIVNSANEMINTGSTAQTMIQSFQETRKIYLQGKEYYDKLRSVSNLVRQARKVQQCILLVGEISDTYINSYQRMLSDPSFTPRELSAIASGYTRLLQEGTNVLRDLQDIINPSELSMTDKERLDVVDKTYAELLRLRNLTSYFTRKNMGVARIRAHKEKDMQRYLSLYGSEDENIGNR